MTRLLVALVSLASLGLAVSAGAARIDVTGFSASSAYPPEEGEMYEGKQGGDGKLATCWVEGDDGAGLGAWMRVELGGTKRVERVKIWPGMWYSYDFWTRANRPKDIELRFSDGSSQKATLQDDMKAQDVKLTKATNTDYVEIRLKSVYNGTTWLDTAISEVQVFDDSASSFLEPRSFNSSSQLAADGDGNYDAQNVQDGLKDSMWCEGNKEGDGVGEWLEWVFDGPREISSLRVINGIGSSLGIWMKGNRATRAHLEFSDGSRVDLPIKNTFAVQNLSFPAKMTTRVRLVFDEISAGREFNDLCLTEAYFN